MNELPIQIGLTNICMLAYGYGWVSRHSTSLQFVCQQSSPSLVFCPTMEFRVP